MYSTFCWSSIPFPSFPLTLHNVLSEIENNRRLMLAAKFIRDELAFLSHMTSSILKCATEAAVGVMAAGGGRGCPMEAAVAGGCVGVTAAGGGRGCPTEVIAGMVGGGIWRASGPCSL